MADGLGNLPSGILMLLCISLAFFAYSHEVLERHSTRCRDWFHLRSPFTEPPNNWVARIWSYILRSLPVVSSIVLMGLELQPALTGTPWLSAEGNACWAQGQPRALDAENFMNPDIGGIGVHLGLVILPWISIGALIYGRSHGCESGVKELCMQNLVKLLTACASIDCVSAAVSMSFSDKRVIASRRLVHTCVLVQLLAFVVSAKALYGFHASDHAISGRCEFQMFWSVPFTSSDGIPPGLWLHFSWRLLVWAHNAYLALLFAGPFHRAEKISRKTLEEKLQDASYTALNIPEQISHALEETSDQNRNIRVEIVYLQYEFDRLPATVFTKYLEHAFTMLVASVSMHGLARDFGGKSKLLHMDWGQRTPLIVCLIGVIHFTYAQARNFGSESLKHLWEVELVTGAYPNNPGHADDYPPWARPTPTSFWSLHFLQRMWCVVTMQGRLSPLRAPNFPRCGPIQLTERLNPSWWDIWKNPFPKSIPLTDEQVEAETRRLWAEFDLLGPSGIRDALLNGARINEKHDDDNRTVLLRLLNANQCHTRIVALALLMGAETDATLPHKRHLINESNALVVASGQGHATAVCYLLDHCSGIFDTATALISATRSAHKNVVDLLISRGLDVNVHCPKTGDTALIAAAGKGHRNMLELLTRNRDTDINAKSDIGNHGSNFDYTWYDHYEQKASHYTWYDSINQFMHGSKPVRRNHKGDAALHRAACSSSLDALEILLDSPRIDIQDRTLSGDTVLIVAIRDGDPALAPDMVRLLLRKKPELASLRNNVGKSPLDFCLERTPNDNTTILEALLEYPEHNVVGLDWEKTWSRQIKQWEEMSWYSQLQSILMKPVRNEFWPTTETWDVLSTFENHPERVDSGIRQKSYISLRLPPRERERILRVHRIVFRIVSNDQGWSSYPETQKFYDGAWTWFEAKIEKQNEQHDGRQRRICRNLHAESEKQQQTVIWDHRDETPYLKNWLRKIEAGDEIQVLAKQQNPGWVNTIHEAEITVFYTCEPSGK